MPNSHEPDPFLHSCRGLILARALTTATMLGVFDALHDEPADAAGLAARLDLDPLGAEALLTTLLAFGYVEATDGNRVRNTEVSERQLVSGSTSSIATFVGEQADLHWEILDGLPAAVRDGKAYAMHEERQDDTPRWEAYIRGLFEISRHQTDGWAALVPSDDPRRLVDVAGGHGAFAMAMCRRHPNLQATIVDLPPSAAIGRTIVAEEGYADRISFRAGDVFDVGIGEDVDVISSFGLVHHLPEERNRELCRMARAALRPGGCLVIGGSARPEPGEAVSELAAIGGLLFYAWSHARDFAASEICAWMEAAGFEEVKSHRDMLALVVVGR